MSQEAGNRVLVAERNPLVITALRGLFTENAHFAIAETARSSAELCEKLSSVETDCVLRTVWLAQSVGEVDERPRRERRLELIRKHALPTDFGHDDFSLPSTGQPVQPALW